MSVGPVNDGDDDGGTIRLDGRVGGEWCVRTEDGFNSHAPGLGFSFDECVCVCVCEPTSGHFIL